MEIRRLDGFGFFSDPRQRTFGDGLGRRVFSSVAAKFDHESVGWRRRGITVASAQLRV